MAIEIVSFPIKNGDFPVRYVKLPGGRIPGHRFFSSTVEAATVLLEHLALAPLAFGALRCALLHALPGEPMQQHRATLRGILTRTGEPGDVVIEMKTSKDIW